MWHHCQNTDCTVCNSTQSQTVKLLYAQRPVFKTETEDTSLFYQQNSASWLSNYNSLQWKPILKLNLFRRIFLYVLTNSVCERKTTDSERQDRQRDKRERDRQTVTENKEASSKRHTDPLLSELLAYLVHVPFMLSIVPSSRTWNAQWFLAVYFFLNSVLYYVFCYFNLLSMIMFVVLVSFVTNFSCFIITVAWKLFLWFNFDCFNSSRCSVQLSKSSWSTEKIHLKRNYLTLSVMSCNVQSVMCPSPTGTNDTVSDVT